MSEVRVTTIDLAADAGPSTDTPCGARLREKLAGLTYPPVPRDEPVSGSTGTETKPYDVRFVFNPKAWGRFPNTEPMLLRIPGAADAMRLALRQEAETAYGLGSWRMVDQLAVGVFGLDRFSALGEFGPSGKLTGTVGSDDLMAVLRDRVAEDRSELLRTFGVVRGELITKADRCLALLESYAACRAVNEELPACDAATLEEARRYLSFDRTDDLSIRRSLANPEASHAQGLLGPEGRDLARALASLAGPYRRLQAAKERFEASLPSRNVAKGAVWLSLLGPLGFPAAVAQAATAVTSVVTGDPERKVAATELARASGEFQARFAELTLRYPILFKIADVVDQVEPVWRSRTVLALQDALDASAALSDTVQKDPAKVWRFPGLIDRSVRRGFAAHATFAPRVASDKLMRENGMPPFAQINAGIQLLTTTLMLVPFPPVKVATALATVLGDVAEMLESYFRTKEQRLGFRAAIDPGLALGPDASYASTVIQGAFVALGLLPIPGAVKEWAEEGVQAARASTLRKVALGAAGAP